MAKRVNVGPGDDPDEYWFECSDCDGTGQVSVPYEGSATISTLETCPSCFGSGSIEGDADVS